MKRTAIVFLSLLFFNLTNAVGIGEIEYNYLTSGKHLDPSSSDFTEQVDASFTVTNGSAIVRKIIGKTDNKVYALVIEYKTLYSTKYLCIPNPESSPALVKKAKADYKYVFQMIAGEDGLNILYDYLQQTVFH